VISNLEVNRTLATLRKAELGFLGLIVEKLTDKSPWLSLYRTVHEICTSYGSSFNSFEVIRSFSSFEVLSITYLYLMVYHPNNANGMLRIFRIFRSLFINLLFISISCQFNFKAPICILFYFLRILRKMAIQNWMLLCG
jgi:hypothetical protein